MISLILALVWSHLRPSCAKLILGASFILRVRSRNYINIVRSAKKWILRAQLVLTGGYLEPTEILVIRLLALMLSHLQRSYAKLILGASYIFGVRSKKYINFEWSLKKWTRRAQLAPYSQRHRWYCDLENLWTTLVYFWRQMSSIAYFLIAKVTEFLLFMHVHSHKRKNAEFCIQWPCYA